MLRWLALVWQITNVVVACVQSVFDTQKNGHCFALALRYQVEPKAGKRTDNRKNWFFCCLWCCCHKLLFQPQPFPFTCSLQIAWTSICLRLWQIASRLDGIRSCDDDQSVRSGNGVCVGNRSGSNRKFVCRLFEFIVWATTVAGLADADDGGVGWPRSTAPTICS